MKDAGLRLKRCQGVGTGGVQVPRCSAPGGIFWTWLTIRKERESGMPVCFEFRPLAVVWLEEPPTASRAAAGPPDILSAGARASHNVKRWRCTCCGFERRPLIASDRSLQEPQRLTAPPAQPNRCVSHWLSAREPELSCMQQQALTIRQGDMLPCSQAPGDWVAEPATDSDRLLVRPAAPPPHEVLLDSLTAVWGGRPRLLLDVRLILGQPSAATRTPY